jgi:hypothetical protein
MEEFRAAASRRLVVEVPARTSLLPAVEAACARGGVAAGYVRLSGRIRGALIRVDPEGAPFELDGPVLLVQAWGRLRSGRPFVPNALLAWQGGGLPSNVAGVLLEAESGGVEAVVEIWEGAASEAPRPEEPAPQSQPASTRLSSRSGQGASADRSDAGVRSAPEPESSGGEPQSGEAAGPPPGESRATEPDPAADPPARGGWAAAVAASQGMSRPPAAPGGGRGREESPELSPGDILIHPRFGRCRVSRASDGERVKVRSATGRLMDLHFKVLTLQRQPDEDGRRVYKVFIKRK